MVELQYYWSSDYSTTLGQFYSHFWWADALSLLRDFDVDIEPSHHDGQRGRRPCRRRVSKLILILLRIAHFPYQICH